MLKRAVANLLFLALLLLIASRASAQAVCPLQGSSSDRLVCLIPQVYGPFGLGSGPPGTGVPLRVNGHQAHFEASFLNNFTPINTALGSQLTLLPLASPSSGILFVYNPALKTFSPSTEESLGPILGERAETIGRHKFFLGFSYQYFNFNSIDGVDLSTLPSAFTHQDTPAFNNPSKICSINGPASANTGTDCSFVRDLITTSNSIDLRVHQYTVYITYGVGNRFDLSAAIPFVNVRMSVRSSARIQANAIAPRIPNVFPNGIFHEFDPTVVTTCAAGVSPCLQGTFSDSNSAKGIGDVLLRGKGTIYKGERTGVALGLDVRLPSGDALNFLGSGAIGIKPFAVFSYSSRVAPHGELGFEFNGSSPLAGDLVAGTSAHLPNRLVYTAGADVSMTKWLTGAFDILGQRLISAPRVGLTTTKDLGQCNDQACTAPAPAQSYPDLLRGTSDYNITNASLGFKIRPFGKMVVTGNVLIKLDDGGLRARAVPLVGVSYSF